jgi:hypothetical protein
MEIFLALLIKPFVMLAFLLIAWPFKWLAQQLPDGRLRRLLLCSVNRATTSGRTIPQ